MSRFLSIFSALTLFLLCTPSFAEKPAVEITDIDVKEKTLRDLKNLLTFQKLPCELRRGQVAEVDAIESTVNVASTRPFSHSYWSDRLMDMAVRL